MRLILASNSLSRRKILDLTGIEYEVMASNVEEKSDASSPKEYVIELSRNKAENVANRIEGKAIVIGADCIIHIGNERFEKPKSKEEAFKAIKRLSGKENDAITGVTIIDLYTGKQKSFVEETKVHFQEMSDNEIIWYIDHEENILYHAGYSLMGKASLFIDKIDGDYYNVIGLPIHKIYATLKEFGYQIQDFNTKD